MKTTIRITSDGYLHINNLGIYEKETESNNWITYCPALKILGYSEKSSDEAFEDLQENVKLFFKIHLEDETLNEALRDIGWESRILANQIDLVSSRSKVSTAPSRLVNIPLQYAGC